MRRAGSANRPSSGIRGSMRLQYYVRRYIVPRNIDPSRGLSTPSVRAPERDVRDQDPGPARERVADAVGVLVVQDPLPPVADDALRHEHDRDDLGVAGGEHVEIADERLDELPVGRLEDEQVHAVDLAPEPFAEAGRLLEVVGHVDRDD